MTDMDNLEGSQDRLIFHEATLDGKRVAYHSLTEFLIQIGKGKSAYVTRYRITGSLAEALFYYKGINIGRGYKKRLYVPSFNKPVLARQFS
jgi:hypothetical protein